MTIQPTASIGGHTYMLASIGDHDAFEVECLLAYLLGPSAAAMLGVLSESLISELVKLAKDAAGEGETFDLAHLLNFRNLESTDVRVEAAWNKFTAALPPVAGQLLAGAVPELTDRAVDHKHVRRLFDIAVIGLVCVEVDGLPKRLKDYSTLAQFTRLRPIVKWQLLAAQLRMHFMGAEVVADGEAAEVAA